jgi:hypothetical protein
MIRRPSSRLRIDTVETQLTEIKLVDKDINHANRIVRVDPIIQVFGEKCELLPIGPLNGALHPIPHKSRENHVTQGVFAHGVIPGSSHTQALGISSPRIDKAHLMGPCNHGGSQWSSMSDWMSH